ncbi:MAG: hypothetical protein ABID61_05965 [Candidatus Micrarchaeota archaeon]
MVKNRTLEAPKFVKDIKRYKLITVFLVISLVFFFTGLFVEPGTAIVKVAALGLIVFGGVSIYLTWAQPSFMSEETTMYNVAVATSHSFCSLAFILAIVFVIDMFVYHITDMLFALFGSIFLSIMAGGLYLAFKLKAYV